MSEEEDQTWIFFARLRQMGDYLKLTNKSIELMTSEMNHMMRCIKESAPKEAEEKR